MIKLSFAVVVAMFCSDYAVADATTDRSADTAELTRLAIESGRAYARRDLVTLEQFTAQDYVQTDVRGSLLNRAEWLEFVKNRKSNLTVDSDGIEVRFYGDVAVVMGHWRYTLKSTSPEAVSFSRWTSVWTHESDGWKRHIFQNTYVNPNADGQVTAAGH